MRALAVVFGLTATFMVVEVIGGLITGSLALLADAGHMLSDAASLALALGAFWLSGRPATPERSFGYKRAEILAALANGVGARGYLHLDLYRGLPTLPGTAGNPRRLDDGRRGRRPDRQRNRSP